jgi:hypothetical protein
MLTGGHRFHIPGLHFDMMQNVYNFLSNAIIARNPSRLAVNELNLAAID